MLHLFQTICHALISHLAVSMLRSALSSCHTDSAWAMCQSHPCLDFIAMLSSWPTGDEKLQITISFQGVTIGWIKFGQNLFLCLSLAKVDYQHSFSLRLVPGLSETSYIIQSQLREEVTHVPNSTREAFPPAHAQPKLEDVEWIEITGVDGLLCARWKERQLRLGDRGGSELQA